MPFGVSGCQAKERFAAVAEEGEGWIWLDLVGFGWTGLDWL